MVLCMLLTFIIIEFKYFNVQVFLCIIIITIIIIITGRHVLVMVMPFMRMC